jgi:hypothetical protein
MKLLLPAIFFSLLFCAPLVKAQKEVLVVVKYHATLETVKYVYGGAPAVARLGPNACRRGRRHTELS